jgi:hypothetical protein
MGSCQIEFVQSLNTKPRLFALLRNGAAREHVKTSFISGEWNRIIISTVLSKLTLACHNYGIRTLPLHNSHTSASNEALLTISLFFRPCNVVSFNSPKLTSSPQHHTQDSLDLIRTLSQANPTSPPSISHRQTSHYKPRYVTALPSNYHRSNTRRAIEHSIAYPQP